MSEPAKDRVGRRRRGPRNLGGAKNSEGPATPLPGGANRAGTAASSQSSKPRQDLQQPLDGVAALKELFPDWPTDDLEVAYNDSLNDVAAAVLRITEGIAVKSVQVKSKKEIRERREQENKEAREASRRAKTPRKPSSKGQESAQAQSEEQKTPSSAAQTLKQGTKQAPHKAPQQASQQASQASRAPPTAAAAAQPISHAPASAVSNQRPDANGKMTWAQILSPQTMLPEPGAEAKVETKQKQKADPKSEQAKEPLKTATEPPKESVQAPSSQTSKVSSVTTSQVPAAQAAAGRPVRPDGTMSWAAALAPPKPKPKPEPKPEAKSEPEAVPADQVKAQSPSSKGEKKGEKKSEKKTTATETEGSSEKKEKKPRSARKKKSPTVDGVTNQIEKLDLPKGPSAESAEQNGVQTTVNEQRAPEIPAAAQVQSQPQRQAHFPPQGPGQQQVPTPMQPPHAPGHSQGQSLAQAPMAPAAAIPTQPYSAFQPQAQPLQGQPLGQGVAQGMAPGSQEMPMMFNPYVTQYGMHGMPPMAANMPPYAMQIPQAPQVPQGQGQQMPGMSMPAMMPAVPMAPSPSMPPQVPQGGASGSHGQHLGQNQHQQGQNGQGQNGQGQNGQDYGAYLAQYNYGYPARGYEYGYDQNAYMYPPYSYNGYAPQMSQPMAPPPDSPAAQQKPMYWQGSNQYGQYYDPNVRHWGEYNQ